MWALLLTMWVVRLNWDANPPAQGVTGYNVYVDGLWQGESGDTEHVLFNVDMSFERCFAVSAFNSAGESPLSTPVCATRPVVPGGTNRCGD